MKTTKAISLLPLVAVLLCGCSDMRFSAYTGAMKEWPVGGGTMADTGYAVPLYRGWPDRPYRVLGMIRMHDPNARWNDGDYKAAAKIAKKAGAEAAVLRQGEEEGVGAIAGAALDPRIIASQQTTVLAIRWRSESELDQASTAQNRLMAEVAAEVPEVASNPALLQVAVEYVRSQPTFSNAPSGRKQLDDLLRSILQQPKDTLSGRWLFRGSVKWNHITSSYTESVVGVAECNAAGPSLTLVSETGRYQINFSGTEKGGRVTGQLGFSAGSGIAAAKCEGAAQKSRIVITGQSQTPDGGFQAAITFLR